MEDNTIAAKTLDVKSYDAVDVLRKLNKQKTLYFFMVESFLLIKFYKMTFIYCVRAMANGLKKSLNKIWMNWRVENSLLLFSQSS